MASSAHDQLHQLPNPNYGTTAAPPPTPSTQPNPHSSSDLAADVLSRLLHRLPPTLSIPTRRRSPPPTAPAAASPPLISLSSENPNNFLTDLLSASSQLGFFQLTNSSIPSQLARSVESESLSLFNLPREQKQLYFPQKCPLGFHCEEDEDDNGMSDSFCFDSSCSIESTELSLASLGEFTREMEKVGLVVVEALSCAVGFENPVREDPTRVCSFMWISEGSPGNVPGRFYPYVVGLHFQIRWQRCSLLADSGWVSVTPEIDSILVTLGDVAQVWSNGKIKKVRGRPVPIYGDDSNNGRCISMSLLVTLPVESTVSPLISRLISVYGEDYPINKDGGGSSTDRGGEGRAFSSFSFEDYAWRVYHERLHLKDSLDQYRI
ncbi:hypothetical protein CsSME_00028701 [Camellia sinensis var. sinensis]